MTALAVSTICFGPPFGCWIMTTWSSGTGSALGLRRSRPQDSTAGAVGAAGAQMATSVYENGVCAEKSSRVEVVPHGLGRRGGLLERHLIVEFNLRPTCGRA